MKKKIAVSLIHVKRDSEYGNNQSDLLARAALNPSLNENKKETDMDISQIDKSLVPANCPMCSEKDNDDMIQCCMHMPKLATLCMHKTSSLSDPHLQQNTKKFTCENCTEEPGDKLQLKCFNSQVYKPIVENFDEDIKLMRMKSKH